MKNISGASQRELNLQAKVESLHECPVLPESEHPGPETEEQHEEEEGQDDRHEVVLEHRVLLLLLLVLSTEGPWNN